jgi:hypothetical protein
MQLGQNSIDLPYPLPKTLRYCKLCQKETPHEIRVGAGVVAKFCVACMERELFYELEKD